ncbi:MAG: TRAP transporter small permease [Phascolarctobacterium sp.]|nr:TRAP transporter small permease [Phascolarctobacterium sp.]
MGKFILKNIEEIVAAACITFTTILVVINVIMRYVLNSGIVWTEEVATGSFVWSVFIGAIAVYKNHGHVGVDMVVKAFPKSVQKVVAIASDILLLVLNGFMGYLAVLYVMMTKTKMTPVLGVSSAYISFSILICFVGMTLYSAYFVYQDICGKKEEEEVK